MGKKNNQIDQLQIIYSKQNIKTAFSKLVASTYKLTHKHKLEGPIVNADTLNLSTVFKFVSFS